MFDVSDVGTCAGAFDAIQLPGLAPRLARDTSQLYTLGTRSVTPEPSTLWLLSGGLVLAAVFDRLLRNARHTEG